MAAADVVVNDAVKVKHAGGRPTSYRSEYCCDIIAYFTVPPQQTIYKRTYFPDGSIKSEDPVILPAQFPTFEGFAESIGVHKDTIYEWGKVYPEFSDSLARAKQIQEQIWLVNSMGNLYNSQFAQFFGKNCLGYKDTQNIEVSGLNGGPLLVQDVSALSDGDLERLIEIAEKLQIQGEVVDITPVEESD